MTLIVVFIYYEEQEIYYSGQHEHTLPWYHFITFGRFYWWFMARQSLEAKM